MDDLVLNFISVTGAGVDEARQMLEICNNDLESAVNMFLEAGIGGVAGADQPARGAPQASGAAVKRKAEEEEHVRAPIAPVRGRLVDDPYACMRKWRCSSHIGLLRAKHNLNMLADTLTASDIPTNVFEKKPEALRDFRAEASMFERRLPIFNLLLIVQHLILM